jgi:hypothetical protein
VTSNSLFSLTIRPATAPAALKKYSNPHSEQIMDFGELGRNAAALHLGQYRKLSDIKKFSTI